MALLLLNDIQAEVDRQDRIATATTLLALVAVPVVVILLVVWLVK